MQIPATPDADPADADPAGDGPAPVERDSRGILDPWLLRQRVRLTRYPPPPPLDGVLDRLWAVHWDLPADTEHRQEVLTHPAANISVGPPDGHDAGGTIEAVLHGVARDVTTRVLRGRGWTVAAMTTVGGLGALVGPSAEQYTDRAVPLAAAIGADDAQLVAAVTAERDEATRVDLLAEALCASPHLADADRLATAREVSAVARLAETDRTIRLVADLAARAGVSERTLHRQFAAYAGVSPAWVLRRYRLLEAAEAVRDGTPVVWAALAHELGYTDQAHLTRDFRAALGRTPAAYARDQAP